MATKVTYRPPHPLFYLKWALWDLFLSRWYYKQLVVSVAKEARESQEQSN